MNVLVERLKQQFLKELPGEAAHLLMASAKRKASLEIPKEIEPKQSSVLLLLVPDNNELKIVLTQRPKYNGVHSRQVSLPGGKVEKEDVNSLATALRETQEEIGVSTPEMKQIGEMSKLYIPPSNFLVTPHLAYLDKVPTFIPDKREVEEVFLLPLSFIKHEKNIVNKNIHIERYNMTIKTPCWEYNGKIIWGATAMILSELRAML
jgi:8-oxo-dGTP pyrophosphatase MutT (NUDIX family)